MNEKDIDKNPWINSRQEEERRQLEEKLKREIEAIHKKSNMGKSSSSSNNKPRHLSNYEIKIYHCHPELRVANPFICGTEFHTIDIEGKSPPQYAFSFMDNSKGTITVRSKLSMEFNVKKYIDDINSKGYGKQDILIIEAGDPYKGQSPMLIAISEYEVDQFNFECDNSMDNAKVEFVLSFNDYTLI